MYLDNGYWYLEEDDEVTDEIWQVKLDGNLETYGAITWIMSRVNYRGNLKFNLNNGRAYRIKEEHLKSNTDKQIEKLQKELDELKRLREQEKLAEIKFNPDKFYGFKGRDNFILDCIAGTWAFSSVGNVCAANGLYETAQEVLNSTINDGDNDKIIVADSLPELIKKLY